MAAETSEAAPAKRRFPGKKHNFTHEQIEDMRRSYWEWDETITSLCGRYGVGSESPIWHIVHGKTYRDAPGPISGPEHKRLPDESGIRKGSRLVKRRTAKYFVHSDSKIRELRYDARVRRMSSKELAEKYHMSRSWVNQLLRGEGRTDAGGPMRPKTVRRFGSYMPNAKLDEEKVGRIIALWQEARMTQEEIATQFGISPGMVGHIVHRRKWKHVPWPEAK